MKLFCILLWMGLTYAWCLGPDSLMVRLGSWESPVGLWWPQKSKALKKTEEAKVLVWFHGGMTSANCRKGLVAGTDLAKLYPDHIVVSVSACRENHWLTSQAIEAVDKALDSIGRIRKNEVKTVSLVGVSDGSLGVFAYSLQGSRLVQNRLLVSSYGGFLGDGAQIAQNKRLQSGRWRFLQGGKDRLYSAEESVPWIESFCKYLGADCALRFDPAGEHDWSYWKGAKMDWIKEAILE